MANDNYPLTQVQEDLLDNADFEESGSVSKAKAFITAAKRWLILRPQSSSHQGNSLSMDVNQVRQMLSRAQSYVAANDTSSAANSNTRFFSAENLR